MADISKTLKVLIDHGAHHRNNLLLTLDVPAEKGWPEMVGFLVDEQRMNPDRTHETSSLLSRAVRKSNLLKGGSFISNS